MRARTPVGSYWTLGALAVLHGVAVGVFFPQSGEWGAQELWIGCATLWFFWPVVLLLHRGRSKGRFVILFSLAAVAFAPSCSIYTLITPVALGMPAGFDFAPWRSIPFLVAYLRGRSDARRDLASNHLVIEEAGLGAGWGPSVQLFRDRYGIEEKGLAGCLVTEGILGHIAGYNSVSEQEISRRYGADIIRQTREEGNQIAQAEQTRREQRDQALAQSLSHLDSTNRVALKTVSIYPESPDETTNLNRQGLEELVHACETKLVSVTPDKGSGFEFRNDITLTPNAPPTVETSASSEIPQTVYDALYSHRNDLPDIRSMIPTVSVHLVFEVREAR